jgi:hypothetical protein
MGSENLAPIGTFFLNFFSCSFFVLFRHLFVSSVPACFYLLYNAQHKHQFEPATPAREWPQAFALRLLGYWGGRFDPRTVQPVASHYTD